MAIASNASWKTTIPTGWVATSPIESATRCAEPSWQAPGGLVALVDLGAADLQAVAAGVDVDHRAVFQIAGQQLARDRVDKLLLDHAFQRPGAIDRVVAAIGQPVHG